ncbi:MAG: hypothetical protein PF517_14865 [Salinivirgaceae bacterium]|jgi:hypothetical protein|nr:hypothetical protein [Salinivirgaceae bacterium]
MDNIESVIWDTITKSAKTKFDTEQFEEHFLGTKKEFADSILFYIINGFASEMDNGLLANKVLERMIRYGCNCSKNDVDNFLADKHILFKEEIYTAHVVVEMFKERKEPAAVLNTVNKMLN